MRGGRAEGGGGCHYTQFKISEALAALEIDTSLADEDIVEPPLASLDLPGFSLIYSLIDEWWKLLPRTHKTLKMGFTRCQNGILINDFFDLRDSETIVAFSKMRIVCNHITNISNLEKRYVLCTILWAPCDKNQIGYSYSNIFSLVIPDHLLASECYLLRPLQDPRQFGPKVFGE